MSCACFRRYGRVVRPGLGVLCLHDMHSRQLLGGGEGVVVETVVPGSGAAQAGLRCGRMFGAVQLVIDLFSIFLTCSFGAYL